MPPFLNAHTACSALHYCVVCDVEPGGHSIPSCRAVPPVRIEWKVLDPACLHGSSYLNRPTDRPTEINVTGGEQACAGRAAAAARRFKMSQSQKIDGAYMQPC